MTHLLSIIVLLLKITGTKSCRGKGETELSLSPAKHLLFLQQQMEEQHVILWYPLEEEQ